MSSLVRRIAVSNSPLAGIIRRWRRAVLNFTLPVPRVIVLPLLAVFLAVRNCYYFLIRVFVCEPLFKAYCERCGRGVRTGVFIHWVSGAGKLVLGDNVLIDGKCTFAFAVRYSEHPTLTIGSNTTVSHGCNFTVGREITIGNHCMIASDARIFDAPGHPTDPVLRKAGNPANPEDVRPIRIHDNAWIGRQAVIFPGVTIGEGSVVVTGAFVVTDVPPYTMVAGNPARVIRHLSGRVATNTCADRQPALEAKYSSRSLEGVLAILRAILGVEVGPTDDFYDAGMTSIMTLPLLVELERRFGVTISEAEFLDARTAQQLADSIDMARAV